MRITNEDIQQAIKEGFANGYEMAKTKFERPYGEWVNSKEGCLCSKCDRPVAYDDCGDRFLSDYCPWCGADMRGKDELKEANNESDSDNHNSDHM